jgi:hypothetical protein
LLDVPVFPTISIDFCNLPMIGSAFVASAACMVKRATYFSVTFQQHALRCKALPIGWLTKGLATKGAGPMVDSKYVRMDPVGELGRCQEVVLDLFTRVGCVVEPTAPSLSHQNWPVKRSYRDIGNSIRAIFSGASLALRCWSYAFYHFLRPRYCSDSKT